MLGSSVLRQGGIANDKENQSFSTRLRSNEKHCQQGPAEPSELGGWRQHTVTFYVHYRLWIGDVMMARSLMETMSKPAVSRA